MKPLEVAIEASAELDAYAEYLDSQRPGHGQVFKDEIADALERVLRMPKVYSPIGQGYRRCVVRRFGTKIIFMEFDDVVWVAAIVHGRRHPDIWKKRTRDTGSAGETT